MEFRQYMHIEKLESDEVDGILLGDCFVFPKLDGANASIWLENGEIRCGSRNRDLSTGEDLQGFRKYVKEHEEALKEYFDSFNYDYLHGEWLVPHTLKTYQSNAWRKFYIFDVYSEVTVGYLPYDRYIDYLKLYLPEIPVIPPIAECYNPTIEQLTQLLEKNTYLIQDGKGTGEGIVIKNYQFVNKYGRATWAKIVRSEFKEEHSQVMGPLKIHGKKMVEEDIVNRYCTSTLIEKTFEKIKNSDDQGWVSSKIPRLLSTVYHDLVVEEIWDIVKKFKYPTIDFRKLNQLIILKIKEIKPELF